MERLKHMGLKRSFVLLAVLCLLAALLLMAGVCAVCSCIAGGYPRGGISIAPDGTITELERPSAEQERILRLLGGIQIASIAVLPVAGLGLAGALFYQLKLKGPISALQMGTERIRAHDLDFTIPEVSKDELGQVCAAFETMRAELLRSNQELWRQAEERKRLNAAFAHDLRNPITVLKGTVKLLRRGTGDEQALDRLEVYTRRIEQYVEAMSGVQRLEQLPVEPRPVSLSQLGNELKETAGLLAPALSLSCRFPEEGWVNLDHGLFLTVAENLIVNTVRFSRSKLELTLETDSGFLTLTAADDGPGFPQELIQNGPKPFGKRDGDAAHFGMGLYTCKLLCQKHGGDLRLQNGPGAVVLASFKFQGQT